MESPDIHTPSAISGLMQVLGSGVARPATPADCVDGQAPSIVAEPSTPEELADVLRDCNTRHLRVIPRGGGSMLGLGNPPQRADVILSTVRLNQVVEHAWNDMTVTVQAGCTVANLQAALAAHGQRLAVEPLWPERATVGGILACGESGPCRLRYGGLRDLIIGVTLALPDGTLAKAGGKVVKNVAGYDLMKLAVGSLGTLGVITQAVLRLHPLPQGERSLSFKAASLRAAQTMVLAALDTNCNLTGVQVRAGIAAECHVDIRIEGAPAALAAQERVVTQIAPPGLAPACQESAWRARQDMWDRDGTAVICKCGILPSQIEALCRIAMESAKRNGTELDIVAQGAGLVELRLGASNPDPMISAAGEIRAEMRALGATTVLMRAPLELKKQLDVWGDPGNSHPLMKSIKMQFDPNGTLSPRRFVGGI